MIHLAFSLSFCLLSISLPPSRCVCCTKWCCKVNCTHTTIHWWYRFLLHTVLQTCDVLFFICYACVVNKRSTMSKPQRMCNTIYSHQTRDKQNNTKKTHHQHFLIFPFKPNPPPICNASDFLRCVCCIGLSILVYFSFFFETKKAHTHLIYFIFQQLLWMQNSIYVPLIQQYICYIQYSDTNCRILYWIILIELWWTLCEESWKTKVVGIIIFLINFKLIHWQVFTCWKSINYGILLVHMIGRQSTTFKEDCWMWMGEIEYHQHQQEKKWQSHHSLSFSPSSIQWEIMTAGVDLVHKCFFLLLVATLCVSKPQ